MFAQGKFNLKKWGRRKINAGLKSHKIAETMIIDALAEGDDLKYIRILTELGRKKYKSLRKSDNARWQKTLRYLIGKGFEPDLIIEKKKEIEVE